MPGCPLQVIMIHRRLKNGAWIMANDILVAIGAATLISFSVRSITSWRALKASAAVLASASSAATVSGAAAASCSLSSATRRC